MSTQFNVLILGYGEMGHAMQHLLGERYSLSIWVRKLTENIQPVSLEKLVPEADIILFCLPVNPHYEILTRIKPLLKKQCLCLSIAKGLDESGNTASEIFSDVLGSEYDYALLYGPMISEEIRTDQYAFAQAGCINSKIFSSIKQLFDGSKLYLQHTTDITGISWSVILKNVYALIFGMADELQLGDNMRGFLAFASLQELDRIVQFMGGQPGSPYDMAGIGDLITTATSEASHHHELGRKLARGEFKEIRGEGIHTLEMVRTHQMFDIKKYPLFQLIDSIVNRHENARQAIDIYLKTRFSE